MVRRPPSPATRCAHSRLSTDDPPVLNSDDEQQVDSDVRASRLLWEPTLINLRFVGVHVQDDADEPPRKRTRIQPQTPVEDDEGEEELDDDVPAFLGARLLWGSFREKGRADRFRVLWNSTTARGLRRRLGRGRPRVGR